ncbi:MAG: Abi family protein [Carboxydocellales bacterium]
MQKAKLSIGDQINYMKDTNGIKFNIVDEEKAKAFLVNNNYYFKLKSYAKNYDKYVTGANSGKYINLEFVYLQELSTIDMYLRKFIIKMTLDIEHFLKTQLLRDFVDNDKEDGYAFVKEFLQEYHIVERNINDKSKHSICSDLVLKYKVNFAIWNIVEVLSFGDFIKLYEMYYKKYKTAGSINNYLWSVKFLRNAAAHNNCLINSLKKPYSNRIKLNKENNTFVSKIPGITAAIRKKKMANPIVHDFQRTAENI